MSEKSEQLEKYIEDLNKRLYSGYEVKINPMNSCIEIYEGESCYFEIRKFGMTFIHNNYDEDSVDAPLLNLALIVQKRYCELDGSCYDDSPFDETEEDD